MNFLHRIADDLAALPARAVDDIAARVIDVADTEARRATGDGRMSGMGRRGPRLRAVSRTRARGSSVTAEVTGVPAGAWAILQSGASPHLIAPRRRGGVMVGRSMRHPVRGPIHHPGSRGKRTWDRVTDEGRRLASDVIADELAKVVR